MLKTKTLDKEKIYGVLLKITFIFILLQPVFDLLSFLNIRGYITIGISTFAKPLIAGFINLALMLVYKKQLWRCGITYGCYLALIIVHTFLLVGIEIETPVILHEIRFMINILYFLVCYHDLRILCDEAPQKEAFSSQLKTVLVITFGIYILLFLLAVVTGTSGMTYEYSDAYKTGFKGWMDSGQIFGHALCICLPFITAFLLNNKSNKKWVRLLCKISIVLPLTVLCLIGTKVSYYIAILVLVAQIVLELFFAIRKKGPVHFINAGICLVCAVACVLVYPVTPVKHNTDINNSVLSAEIGGEALVDLVEKEKDKHKHNLPEKNDDETPNDNLSEREKNAQWTYRALEVLEQKYADGELHPADMRNRQLIFNFEKFKHADFKYKLFGIGYVMNGDMAIERDVLCMFFSFGIVGFIIVLLRPVLIWGKAAFTLLRRLLKSDIHTLCLFEGFSMFFFISWYAGATFIYTNFSIFLAIIMCLLTYSIDKLNAEPIKED